MFNQQNDNNWYNCVPSINYYLSICSIISNGSKFYMSQVASPQCLCGGGGYVEDIKPMQKVEILQFTYTFLTEIYNTFKLYKSKYTINALRHR